MKPNSSPEVIELDVEQLENRLQQIEQSLGEETARPFRQLIRWYLQLQRIIQLKNLSISRLRDILFGAKTERTRLVNDEPGENANSPTIPLLETTDTANVADPANMTDVVDRTDAVVESDGSAPPTDAPREPNEL